MADIRKAVLEHVLLLASPAEQGACLPDELVCGFVDDLFHPKSPEFVDAFDEEELKDLAELYGILCLAARSFSNEKDRTVSNFQKNLVFREVMAFAKELQNRFKRNWLSTPKVPGACCRDEPVQTSLKTFARCNNSLPKASDRDIENNAMGSRIFRES